MKKLFISFTLVLLPVFAFIGCNDKQNAKVHSSGERAKDSLKDAQDDLEDTWDSGVDYSKEKWDDAKEEVKDSYEDVKEDVKKDNK